MPKAIFPTGEHLYLEVRIGFLRRGKTLSGWCRERGVFPSNARQALVGAWRGPKGQELKAELIRESGVEPLVVVPSDTDSLAEPGQAGQ
jgi:hypothetical protein